LIRNAHCSALALIFFAQLVLAQTAVQDTVLVEVEGVKLMKSEYDAELLKLAPQIRPGFANSPQRVNDLLNRLVIQKVLAKQAEDRKLADTPENAIRVRMEAERVLAQLRIAEVEERAAKEFDSRRAQFDARARELYLADRAKYETPERVSASHILFDLRRHSKEEGEQLAREARAKVLAGADFNQLAKEISEDPSAGVNGGRLENFARADMDPAFADAAFALKKPGDLSEPVLSKFGWHVIKLENRTPASIKSFEEVRGQIIADLRKKYIDEQRETVINKIRGDPSMKINQEAVDALVIRTDPEAIKRMTEEAAAKSRAVREAAPK
jgi:peptidyl-prolyl cis-trans isomerase C